MRAPGVKQNYYIVLIFQLLAPAMVKYIILWLNQP